MSPQILYICEKKHKNIEFYQTQSTNHSHDHPEISIILSGHAHYTIQGKSYILDAGQMIIFKQNIFHSVSIPPQAIFNDFHIGISHLVGTLAELPTLFTDGILIVDFTLQKKGILDLAKLITYEATQHKRDGKLMLEALILQLLVLTSRELDQKEQTQSQPTTTLGYPDKHKVVEWIKEYILANYANDISLEMFAKDMYLSQVYISKIFKEETGHSPIHFLIKTRLAKAKELLETQTLSIKEISTRVGYEDAYHFSKLFKKYYGYPPSTLRKDPNKTSPSIPLESAQKT